MTHDRLIDDLIAHGLMQTRPHRERAPDELNWRHRLMARLMIFGCADAGMLAFIQRTTRVREGKKTVSMDAPPPKPGEPLTVSEAAQLAGVRKRYGRELVKTKIFKDALDAGRRELRDQAEPDGAEEAP